MYSNVLCVAQKIFALINDIIAPICSNLPCQEEFMNVSGRYRSPQPIGAMEAAGNEEALL